MKKEDFKWYWICFTCAEQKGGKWPEGHVATVAPIKCEYCNDKNRKPDEASVPYVDFDWPGLSTKYARD